MCEALGQSAVLSLRRLAQMKTVAKDSWPGKSGVIRESHLSIVSALELC